MMGGRVGRGVAVVCLCQHASYSFSDSVIQSLCQTKYLNLVAAVWKCLTLQGFDLDTHL